jgi:hypothetical protein
MSTSRPAPYDVQPSPVLSALNRRHPRTAYLHVSDERNDVRDVHSSGNLLARGRLSGAGGENKSRMVGRGRIDGGMWGVRVKNVGEK